MVGGFPAPPLGSLPEVQKSAAFPPLRPGAGAPWTCSPPGFPPIRALYYGDGYFLNQFHIQWDAVSSVQKVPLRRQLRRGRRVG